MINAIRKEDEDKPALLGLDYASDLWLEKEIKSVANVTRADLRDTLDLAARIDLRPTVEAVPLWEANRALCSLRAGGQRGARVLEMRG